MFFQYYYMTTVPTVMYFTDKLHNITLAPFEEVSREGQKKLESNSHTTPYRMVETTMMACKLMTKEEKCIAG